MQRMAACLVVVGAIALVAGCKGKDEGMAMGPAQSASVDYQDPSTSYYAPDATSGGRNDGFAYYDGAQASGGTAVQASVGGAHTVAKGDTLYSLARQYYGGDMSKWKVIYEANRDRISNPDVLKVGQQIVIP